MKIAVLAHSFPRFPGDTHGPFVKHLSEAIAQEGHEVHVLVPWDEKIGLDPQTPLHIHPFKYVIPKSWHLLGYSRTMQRDTGMKRYAYLLAPLYFAFAERALLQLVRRENIDLMHTHWILPNGYVASRVSRRTGVPYVATLHGTDVFMAERNGLFTHLGKKALEGASWVSSCSGDLRDRLLRLGGSEHADKVDLVSNGTQLVPRPQAKNIAATRQHWGFDSDDQILLGVGRLVDKKGFRYLLDAAPDLMKDHPKVRLVIGGGGDLEDELKAQAAQLGIAHRTTFTGDLAHHEVLALIAAADIFVMPSVRDDQGNIDGLPIVVLEAMAAARPLVASDLTGIPLAVTHGETGLLVAERDVPGLRGALESLLINSDRRRQMGEAARRRIEQELHWGAIAQRHLAHYRKALS